MCGIFAYLCNAPEKKGSDIGNSSKLYDSFNKTSHRGPDISSFVTSENSDHYTAFGFHRLSIVGVDDGNQPFMKDGVSLVVNGEIYNYKELKKKYNLNTVTDSDCEVILHLYIKYGLQETIRLLDGVWAMVLYDSTVRKLYFARDVYGVRPLFYGSSSEVNDSESLFTKNHCGNEVDIVIGSELKNISSFSNCVPVKPRYIYTVSTDDDGCVQVDMELYDYNYSDVSIVGYERYSSNKINRLLRLAVIKRLNMERNVGFLLSGGLDSSLVLSIAMQYICDNRSKFSFPINVFSIGTKNESPDVDSAVYLVGWLNDKYGEGVIKHHVVDFSVWDLGVVERVIYVLESWDTTTIRSSIPMYLMSKYIRDNTDVKVIMSGEGSDELFGGYLYFHNAPNSHEFLRESFRLLDDIYLYDGLRADRTTASNGLEVRVPFLDLEFTQYIKNIDTDYKMPQLYDNKMVEKYILRDAHNHILPDKILWRTKNGMSDGVGTCYQMWIQGIALDDYGFDYSPSRCESLYYKKIFDRLYPGMDYVIPYMWMPKWSNNVNDDPSGLAVSY